MSTPSQTTLKRRRRAPSSALPTELDNLLLAVVKELSTLYGQQLEQLSSDHARHSAEMRKTLSTLVSRFNELSTRLDALSKRLT